MTTSEDNVFNDEEKEAKIKELQEIITTAEETIFSAKQLLANLQPELTPDEMPIGQANDPEEVDGQIIYGFFDGQIMIGDDGKQYPVPANYASKSKLVEGDKLKLTITKDNRFMYKQIGPVQRNYFIGIVQKDERGNFTIKTASKKYKVLLAAATYFKIEPGDEVTLIVPQDKDTVWGAIENVLQKNTGQENISSETATTEDAFSINTADTQSANNTLADASIAESESVSHSKEKKPTAIERLEQEMKEEKKRQTNQKTKAADLQNAVVDEWESDIEKLKQEANMPITSNN
jgi:hypothetical protein